MKKILSIITTVLLLLVIAVSCAQDVTVDAQLYNKEDTDVFMLNGKYYATLQEAVNARLGKGAKAAGDNDGVIYLRKNAAGPGAVINDPNTPVTIDFAGYTYSFKDVTATEGSTTGSFGLSISGGSEVTLKGTSTMTLFDSTANLTMVYVEGASTTLTIEGAPKMKVEPTQYLFWAANGATLTIGGETTMTGGLAATGTEGKVPLVSINDGAKADVSNMKLESAKVVPNSTKELKVASLDSSESKIISTGSGAVTITESEGTVVVQNTGTGTVKVDENTIPEGQAKNIEDGQEKSDATVSVAMIGTKEYGTFENACSDSISGDTITLLANINLTSYPRLDGHEFAVSGRTIDLNEKTISVRNKGVVFTGTNLVIKNGTFTAVPNNAVGETINDSYALFIGKTNTATATLENLTLNGGLNVSHGSTVTIQGSETSINATKYYAVWAQGESVVTIKDGSYTFVTSGTVTTTNLPNPASVLNVGKGETVSVDLTCGTIIVENGKFIAPDEIPGIGSSRTSKLANVGEGGTAGINIALKGGVYSADPSAYVAEGYVAVQSGSTWTVVPVFASGKGTEEDPFIIANAEQLGLFRDSVNHGRTYEDIFIKLNSDIALTGTWTPIGNGYRNGSAIVGNVFMGTFDGSNLTISGLSHEGYVPDPASVTDSNEYTYGLFGVVNGATIKNVKLTNVNINGGELTENAGGIVGFAVGDATIYNCKVEGTVTGYNGVGGIVGRAYGTVTIDSCKNVASVTGSKNVGGIAGFVSPLANGTIRINECKNEGAVTRNESTETGGNAAGIACYGCGGPLVGTGSVIIKNNENSGEITATGRTPDYYAALTSYNKDYTSGTVDVQSEPKLPTLI